jgi:hypothetical protein
MGVQKLTLPALPYQCFFDLLVRFWFVLASGEWGTKICLCFSTQNTYFPSIGESNAAENRFKVQISPAPITPIQS